MTHHTQNLNRGDVLRDTALSKPVTIHPIKKEPGVHFHEAVVPSLMIKNHSGVIRTDAAEAQSAARHVIMAFPVILNVIHLMSNTTENGHMIATNAKRMNIHHRVSPLGRQTTARMRDSNSESFEMGIRRIRHCASYSSQRMTSRTIN